MEKYHKIQTIFKRDITLPKKPIIIGEWTLPEFEYLKDNLWEGTEKVDGTNIRIIFTPANSFEIKGKTEDSQIPVKLFNSLYKECTNKKELVCTFFEDYLNDGHHICFYGEGYGSGIQSGGNYSKEQKFVLFDIKIGNWWLPRTKVEEIAAHLNLDIVPIIIKATLLDIIEFGKEGFNSAWGTFKAEGIVAVPLVPLKGSSGDRIITKIKHKDFNNHVFPETY